MSLEDPTDTFPALPPHAHNKWTQRSKKPGIALARAWEEGVPVDLPNNCPWGPNALLHDPGNVVLIYDEASENNVEWVVKTVLQAELLGTSASIIDDHLDECDCCGNRYSSEKADGDCHWCQQGYGPTVDESDSSAEITSP